MKFFIWYRGGIKGGFNTPLYGTKDLRYKDTNGLILGYPAYSPSYYGHPRSIMFLSLGDNCFGGVNNVVNISEDLISAIYPNPAVDKIYVDLKNEAPAKIEIVNILGQVVVSDQTSSIKASINVATLPAGVYIVRVKQNSRTQTAKFVKK
jgi:hypothetical protein